MSEIYLKNINIIKKRWPQIAKDLEAADSNSLTVDLAEGLSSTLLVNGIQLTSRHDRLSEAKLQASSISEESAEIHLYGTGLGDLQRELLSRADLLTLHVHILNDALFSLVINLVDQTPWLNDPRVKLNFSSNEKEIQLPFVVVPSELILANDRNSKIRDRLVSEIEIDFVNRQFNKNDPKIIARLNSNITLVENDLDVAQLFGHYPGSTICIIATGPSLSSQYDALKSLRIFPDGERPVFICVDTALKPIIKNNIVPDYVITIDKNIKPEYFPENLTSDIKLVYFPMVKNETLISWHGQRYAAYSFSSLYDSLSSRLPRGRLFSEGSVIHPATDLAVQMGAKNIIFFGADFGFSEERTHAGWNDGVLANSVTVAKHWVLNGFGERIKTQSNFKAYLCRLERYIASHPEVTFYNTSYEGARIDGTLYHPEFAKDD